MSLDVTSTIAGFAVTAALGGVVSNTIKLHTVEYRVERAELDGVRLAADVRSLAEQQYRAWGAILDSLPTPVPTPTRTGPGDE